MIRRNLPQVLVLSLVVLLFAATEPAAASTSFRPPEADRGLWTETREMFIGVLRAMGLGAPERERPGSVVANVGSILDPDGTPSGAPNGSGTPPVDESH
jgi:hypothetical protein